MQNNKFLVLDIGSGKLRLAELEFDNGQLELEDYQEVEYAGFTDGAFIEDDFLSSCQKLLEDVDCEEIKSVYVGVPSEFCGQTIKELTSTFDAPIDLEDKTKKEFLKYAESEEVISKINDGIVIDVDIINLTKMNNPSSDESSSNSANIIGKVSYIFADKEFLDKISSTFEKLGYSDIEFTSSINAQSKQMINKTNRDIGTVLVDVGYLTTSVAVVKGEAIETLRSFSLGGAHISAELCESLNIPFKLAEKLKRKVLLTVDPSEVDYYVVSFDDKEYEFQASKVNKIVKAKIEHIAVMISKCIKDEEFAYQFVITGGALNDIKGALDILSTKLGVVAKAEKLSFDDLDKPEHSAIISLIKEASQKIYDNIQLPFWKKLCNKMKNLFKF